MTTRAKTAIGIVLATLVVGGTVFGGRGSSGRPGAAARAGGAGRLGEQRRWALTFDVGLAQQSAQPMHVLVTGSWLATIVAVRDGEYDVAHEIADPRIDGGGFPTPGAGEIDALRARLSARFWVTYRNDGTALRMHFPTAVSPTDRNLLQMIVTQTQLVRAAPEAAQWTALERDAAGLYLASYQASAGRIDKRKLRYVESNGATGATGSKGIQIDLTRSDARFSFGDAGELAAFDGTDHMRVGMPMGQSGALDVRATTKLDGVSVARALDLVGGLAVAGSSVESTPVRTHQVDPAIALADRDRRLLEGQTAVGLLAAAAEQTSDRALAGRLAALFRRDAAAIPAAVALVRKQGKLPLVTHALASSGAPAAIAALGRIAHDAGAPEALRIEALTSFMIIQPPNSTAMRAALDMFDDDAAPIRRAAWVVSGALARAGRPDHAADAAAIDDALLARWARSKTVADRTDLLSALGNSVGPNAVPAIAAALHDPEAPVRGEAARALRLAEGDAVDAALAQAMTADKDPQVRSAAVFAVGFRSAEPFIAPLIETARKDPVQYVRLGAIKRLREHADESPRIATALAGIAANDPSAAVRRVAAADGQ